MFYYADGHEYKNSKVRIIISQTENEITGRTPMDEEEAVALLTAYDNEDRIAVLKSKLAETDYIACKIAEGAATVEEYAEVIEQRQEWRNEINLLGEANV